MKDNGDFIMGIQFGIVLIGLIAIIAILCYQIFWKEEDYQKYNYVIINNTKIKVEDIDKLEKNDKSIVIVTKDGKSYADVKVTFGFND